MLTLTHIWVPDTDIFLKLCMGSSFIPSERCRIILLDYALPSSSHKERKRKIQIYKLSHRELNQILLENLWEQKLAKNLIRKSINSFDSTLLPSSHNVFLNHFVSATDFANASISAKATILAGCDKNLISWLKS